MHIDPRDCIRGKRHASIFHTIEDRRCRPYIQEVPTSTRRPTSKIQGDIPPSSSNPRLTLSRGETYTCLPLTR